MQDKKIKKLDEAIEAIRRALGKIGPMRPGGLTRQYREPAEKVGGYWKLGYTHQGRSCSENVRENELKEVQAELEEYRKFQELCARWVDLALQRSLHRRGLKRQAQRQSAGSP